MEDLLVPSPFRARFGPDPDAGSYSFLVGANYYTGTFKVKPVPGGSGSEIELYDVRMRRCGCLRKQPRQRQMKTMISLAEGATQTLNDVTFASFEGEVKVMHGIQDEQALLDFRPTEGANPLMLIITARLVEGDGRFLPGGQFACGLLRMHAETWLLVTAAALVVSPLTTCHGGVAAYCYVLYLPLALYHLWCERRLLEILTEEESKEIRKQYSIFDSFFFSFLDHADVFTDTTFVVIAMRCSEEITKVWAASWQEVPFVGEHIAAFCTWLGFGWYVFLCYACFVFIPQGIWVIWQGRDLLKSSDFLQNDPVGEKAEECILRLQDFAATAMAMRVKACMRLYVKTMYHREPEIMLEWQKIKEGPDLDETKHAREFKKFCMENLLQATNQVTFLGLTFNATSTWALIQVLVTLLLGLCAAMKTSFDLFGGDCCDAIKVPCFLLEWFKWEMACARLTYYQYSGELVVVERPARSERIHTESFEQYRRNALSWQLQHEEQQQRFSGYLQVSAAVEEQVGRCLEPREFRKRLVHKRRRAVAISIAILCLLVFARLIGTWGCEGPVNLTPHPHCVNHSLVHHGPESSISLRVVATYFAYAAVGIVGVAVVVSCFIGVSLGAVMLWNYCNFNRAALGDTINYTSSAYTGGYNSSTEMGRMSMGRVANASALPASTSNAAYIK